MGLDKMGTQGYVFQRGEMTKINFAVSDFRYRTSFHRHMQLANFTTLMPPKLSNTQYLLSIVVVDVVDAVLQPVKI